MARKRTILVVDDMENVRHTIARLLELSGFQAVEAESGEIALEKIEKGNIDLTLLDVVMPVKGGIETAYQIKSLDRGHRVILMSAYANHFFSKHGLPEGISAFLSKPVEPQELLRTVERELAAGI